MRRLSLLVPGLLGPELAPRAASGREGAGAAMTEGLAVAAIERVLARADRTGPASTQDRELFRHAGVEIPGDAEPPVAAVALLGEDAPGATAPGDGWWLRADPVHLRADLTDLVLTDPAQLDLAQDEAERLAAPLAAHLAQDRMQLHVCAPARWYLRLPEPAALTTDSPAEALGRMVSSTLPRGDDGRAWHTRINEAQMILHASEVNRERAGRGLAPVNSVWLWGGGTLPEPGRTGVDAIAGAGVLGRGLGRLIGARALELPERFADLEADLDATAHAVVLPRALATAARLTDIERWRESVARLDDCWIGPSLEALRAGRLESLELRSRRTGVLRLARAQARRFWRRTRPLATWMDAARAENIA